MRNRRVAEGGRVGDGWGAGRGGGGGGGGGGGWGGGGGGGGGAGLGDQGGRWRELGHGGDEQDEQQHSEHDREPPPAKASGGIVEANLHGPPGVLGEERVAEILEQPAGNVLQAAKQRSHRR